MPKSVVVLAVVLVAIVVLVAFLFLTINGLPAPRGRAVVTVTNGETFTADMNMTVSGSGAMMSCSNTNGTMSSMCQYSSRLAPGHSITYTVGLASACNNYRFSAWVPELVANLPKTAYICPGESVPIQLTV